MQTTLRRNWQTGTADSHIAIMRSAPRSDLVTLARSYDWAAHPEPVLGWVMAQKDIALDSALAVFFDGDPERFNYLSKRAVPRCHAAGVRLLDNICLRINCGFYLPGAHPVSADMARLNNWIAAQKADRAEGACGRWVLDEAIVARLSAAGVPARPRDPAPRASGWIDRVRALLMPGGAAGIGGAACGQEPQG
ncbi:hypothetical protein [Roseovarius dicentrarchi]|uniref:hypothetical protein n=1 Tax=Roseovarius dicentrarchi TaxID=2250573 RepID=UPI000DE972C4|nr:hypothetical protein [Roseovarius dicentrarchi]